MPKFSQKSTSKLSTCEQTLQTVLNEAIRFVDFSVIYGHRTPDEQMQLYKKGRKLNRNSNDPENAENWKIEDKSKVVTYLDGHIKKSRHNYSPSKAFDVIPYPFNGWDNKEDFHYLAGVIMTIAEQMYKDGRIPKMVEWGGFWHSFTDLPHFQVT